MEQEKRVYYFSNYDDEVHNITDVKHKIVDKYNAYIGKETANGFRVDDEVSLWTIEELIELCNPRLDYESFHKKIEEKKKRYGCDKSKRNNK